MDAKKDGLLLFRRAVCGYQPFTAPAITPETMYF